MGNFTKESVAAAITTAPTRTEGKTVTFNKAGDVTVSDYDGSINWEEVSTTAVDLNLDQKKYFAFSVDDVDAVQASGDMVDTFVSNASGSIQEEVDSYVFGLYTEAHEDNVIGDDTEPESVTKDNAYDYIVDLGTKLSKKKVPKNDRYVVVNAEYLGLLSKDDRFSSNPTVLENGVVEGQVINGMQVVVSEELSTNENGDYKVIAMHRSAIGHDTQVDDVEALRLESQFADGVRGLSVYGATALRPEAMAVLTASIG
ncbi:hypothetical protein [Alteribacillus sp. YIM 98480]|uniref:phage major capsid protein n=1 Tax=Alteribacillus sp. YIM 98480 TaxID=2606599 RepID=UPI001E407349|nr:hypothetical protein [Alteribacillus sp. YIM 98480]